MGLFQRINVSRHSMLSAGNGISRDGAEALAEALKRNRSLLGIGLLGAELVLTASVLYG